MKNFLWKLIRFFWPSKNVWYMLFISLPAVLLGWWLLPVTSLTYFKFIVIVLLVSIWHEVLEVKDKLTKK